MRCAAARRTKAQPWRWCRSGTVPSASSRAEAEREIGRMRQRRRNEELHRLQARALGAHRSGEAAPER
ncbi:MAG: hypothetical protein AN487_22380 [Anabaena sp. CRKS33]|nr:MAG: hypothetical protein AN487_22380 [Anabaena sp. CRKS33]